MTHRPEAAATAFEIVWRIGLTLPDVKAVTKYDGSPVLKVEGGFVAGLVLHAPAEPETLVVRTGLEECDLLVDDAPESQKVIGRIPLLAPLRRAREDALRDLLAVSWRRRWREEERFREFESSRYQQSKVILSVTVRNHPGIMSSCWPNGPGHPESASLLRCAGIPFRPRGAGSMRCWRGQAPAVPRSASVVATRIKHRRRQSCVAIQADRVVGRATTGRVVTSLCLRSSCA